MVGESGSGKSTLARILLGLDTPDSGVIALGEHAIGSLTARERASWIQPVFQTLIHRLTHATPWGHHCPSLGSASHHQRPRRTGAGRKDAITRRLTDAGFE